MFDNVPAQQAGGLMLLVLLPGPQVDAKIQELQEGLTEMMSQDPPRSVQDLITFVKGKKQEQVGD
jgi:hypothetical protein